MDHVALRIPFAGDCFGKFVCRRVQRAPRRRFNRFPVEQDRTALTDMRDFPRMNEVYARVMGDARPARSTVQVSALPRGVLVEIDLIAAIPSAR